MADMSEGQEASTYDWDTVFALPVADVNRAIVTGKSSPRGFSYDHVEGGSRTTTSARFGDWQVAQGGDGKNLRMTIPLAEIAVGAQYFGNGTATIEVKLQYLPHTDGPAPAQGRLVKLVVRNTSSDLDNDPVVVLVGEIAGASSMGLLQQAIFQVGLGAWLNANLAAFTHVFAVVNLNDRIDQDAQWAFTKPTYVDYAYTDGATLDQSTFGVLCMTGGRRGEGLSEQISPNAIPQGSRAGFLVAPARFLTDLLLPAMLHCYKGLGTDDLLVASDASSLSLKPGRTPTLSGVEHDGTSYSPVLEELEVSLLGQSLEIRSHTKTEVSPGIWSITEATHWYAISLGSLPNGTQTLKYRETQPAQIEHTTEKSTGVVIGEIIAAVLTAVAVVVAGVLTDGAAFVVAALVIGALGGVAAATPEIIAAANTDDSPDIDALRLNVMAPVTWPDSKDFRLDFAGLNGSLQLGGQPSFGAA
jgi:hypothetical protein